MHGGFRFVARMPSMWYMNHLATLPGCLQACMGLPAVRGAHAQPGPHHALHRHCLNHCCSNRGAFPGVHLHDVPHTLRSCTAAQMANVVQHLCAPACSSHWYVSTPSDVLSRMHRLATMRTPDAGEGWQLDAALPVVRVASLDVLVLVCVLVRVLVGVRVKSMCLQAANRSDISYPGMSPLCAA